MRFIELAKAYEASQKAVLKAQEQLQKAIASERDAWIALESARPQSATGNGGSKAKSSSTSKSESKRARRSAEEWETMRESLYAAMKPGKSYSGEELRALVGFEGKLHNWNNNVQATLHGDGYLTKIGKARATRWKRA